jgi:ubiquinol oxidase
MSGPGLLPQLVATEAAGYGRFASVADLVRQIGCDERQHKNESLARLAEPRLR